MKSSPKIAHGGTDFRSPERRPAKVLESIRIKGAVNGGHVIEHHFTSYEHQPESHAFGKDQGEEALEHIGKHMGMKLGGGEDEVEEEEVKPGKK